MVLTAKKKKRKQTQTQTQKQKKPFTIISRGFDSE